MANIADLIHRVAAYIPEVPDPVALDYLRDAAREFCQFTGCDERFLDPVYLIPGVVSYTPTTPAETELARVIEGVFNDTDRIDPSTHRQQLLMDSQYRTRPGPRPDAIVQLSPNLVGITPMRPATDFASIVALSNTAPVVVSTAGVTGLIDGDRVYIKDSGATGIDGYDFEVSEVVNSDFTLVGTAASGASVTGSWVKVLPLVLRAAVKPTLDAETLNDDVFDEYGKDLAMGAAGSLLMLPRRPWTDLAYGAALAGAFEAKQGEARTRVQAGRVHPLRRMRYGGY